MPSYRGNNLPGTIFPLSYESTEDSLRESQYPISGFSLFRCQVQVTGAGEKREVRKMGSLEAGKKREVGNLGSLEVGEVGIEFPGTGEI